MDSLDYKQNPCNEHHSKSELLQGVEVHPSSVSNSSLGHAKQESHLHKIHTTFPSQDTGQYKKGH